MTVIATLVTKEFTAHATDSFIARRTVDGTYEIVEKQRTKIVCVRQFAGAIAYFGFAGLNSQRLSTLRWLQERVADASRFAKPEDFARYLGAALDKWLSSIGLAGPTQRGIGMHFTAYEDVEGYRIPELFAITNFESTRYDQLHPDGIRVTRETYGVIENTDDRLTNHALPRYRHRVRMELAKGGILAFNNGDPILFNPISSAMFTVVDAVHDRSQLATPKPAAALRYLAKWPIQSVATAQKKLMLPGYQLVGGKIHDLSISSLGEYESDSGDDHC